MMDTENSRGAVRAMIARRLADFSTAGLGLTLLAGCGGPSSPARPVTSAPGSVMSHPKSPATKQQLQKIVLQASDLPPGWKASPYQGVPDRAAYDAAMARCTGIRDTTPDIVAEAITIYTSGKIVLYSVAASYRSERDLDEDFGTVNNPRTSPCFERLYRANLGESGLTIESISAKVIPAPAGSPANVVGVDTATVTGTLGARKLVERDITVGIRGPLIEAQVEMVSFDAPIPQELMNSVVAKVASRAVGR